MMKRISILIIIVALSLSATDTVPDNAPLLPLTSHLLPAAPPLPPCVSCLADSMRLVMQRITADAAAIDSLSRLIRSNTAAIAKNQNDIAGIVSNCAESKELPVVPDTVKKSPPAVDPVIRVRKKQ